jgi:hypothetical protein
VVVDQVIRDETTTAQGRIAKRVTDGRRRTRRTKTAGTRRRKRRRRGGRLITIPASGHQAICRDRLTSNNKVNGRTGLVVSTSYHGPPGRYKDMLLSTLPFGG